MSRNPGNASNTHSDQAQQFRRPHALCTKVRDEIKIAHINVESTAELIHEGKGIISV